jgi:hypothetical protein
MEWVIPGRGKGWALTSPVSPVAMKPGNGYPGPHRGLAAIPFPGPERVRQSPTPARKRKEPFIIYSLKKITNVIQLSNARVSTLSRPVIQWIDDSICTYVRRADGS